MIRHKGSLVLGLCVIAVFALFTPAEVGAAEANYTRGTQLYGQRKFKEAAAYLTRAVKASPRNSNAYYYLALSYHQLGDYKNARSTYKRIIQLFPNTEVYRRADAALKKIDPNYAYKTKAGSGGTSRSTAVTRSQSSGDILPNHCRVPYTRQGNHLFVTAELNNRRIPMIFDTGAESCVFGQNHLKQLGIKPPSGKHHGLSLGVGSSKGVKTWNMRATLKLGSIKRTNFPISVHENLPAPPLLGQSFFRDFEYTIDPEPAKTILFTRKSTGGSSTRRTIAGSNYSVPFTREGNELIVKVQVNGREIPMYFDTGAHGVTMAPMHVKRLGLKIPEDAKDSMAVGIGGATRSKKFNVRSMKMGPVFKRDMPVTVVEQSTMKHPLLGQTFFKDWQFTIDNEKNVIRFVRR